MLTEQQRDFLTTNGYLILPELLASDELAQLQQATDELIERSRTVEKNDSVYGLLPGHCAERPLVHKIKKPAFKDAKFDQVRQHPKSLAIVNELIGPNVVCNRHKISIKPPHTEQYFPWHQDWAYQPYSNDDIYHMLIAIDDLTIDNGTLLIIPGSHRTPIYNHHQEGLFTGTVDPASINLQLATPLNIKAGDGCLIHIRTLHSSPPNHSNQMRRLFLLEYASGDAWPLLGISNWESYSASFVLGEPTLEPRWTDVPKRLPFPGLRGKLQKL